MFQLLRNRYGRDKKKVAKKKVSGAGAKDIEEAKESSSDLYPFMPSLDPYMKSRKTKTNVISLEMNESDQELPEDGDIQEEDGDIQEEDDNDSSISEISDSRGNIPGKMQSHKTGHPKYVKRARR